MGDFPVAVIIFAGIALFLILRLRSILGRRVGFERPSAQRPGPTIEGEASRPVPDPQSALGERLMQIVNRDPQFDPPKFLTAAEQNFRAIVTAFAAGDRPVLQSLLTDSVFASFDAAIAEREAAGQTHQTDIKSVRSARIEDAQLIGDQAAIIVRFTSDQVNVTMDATGTPVIGSPDVTEIIDLWTFERQIKAKDPVWRLAAARHG
jgi:predicted lipid-binding transport protein (Tim44 family)